MSARRTSSPVPDGTTRTRTTWCSGCWPSEPLGLRHTWYQPTEEASSDGAHGYRFASGSKEAPAIDLSDGSPYMPFTSVVTAAAAAGGFASNSTDLARWARALYAGAVLSEDSVDAMLGDIDRTAPYNP